MDGEHEEISIQQECLWSKKEWLHMTRMKGDVAMTVLTGDSTASGMIS